MAQQLLGWHQVPVRPTAAMLAASAGCERRLLEAWVDLLQWVRTCGAEASEEVGGAERHRPTPRGRPAERQGGGWACFSALAAPRLTVTASVSRAHAQQNR